MRLSIQRLRWVLLAGAVLLLCILAAFIGYGRYQALKAYRQIIARSGVSLTRDSNGVTYSQSVKGRKIFTIRAKTESSLGNGKWALHNAEMRLYNRNGDEADHVSGSEIEYDENEGVAHASGDVFMDIEPPRGLANGGRISAAQPTSTSKPDAASAPVIHVRTSGLVYLRKRGIASTDQQVEISYGDMRCTAAGAEFNSDQSTLRLLANVRMDGLARGKPVHVTAARADMDQNADVATLAQPVVLSDGQSARADTAILHLRKDGSIEQVQGINHVVITSTTENITANRLDAELNAQSLPQSARLSGDVMLIGSDPLMAMHGSAAAVDAVFNAQGSPTRITATGQAKIRVVDHKADPSGLVRSMEGDTIVALLAPGPRKSSTHLTEVHTTGSAHTSGQAIATRPTGTTNLSTAPGLKTVQVWADDLRVVLASSETGKAQPETLNGTGHTMFRQDGPLGDQEISRGDTLEIAFNSAPEHTKANGSHATEMSVLSAVQTGHVTIHERGPVRQEAAQAATVSAGTADRTTYLGASQTLTLAGDAYLFSDTGSVTAPTISLSQRTGDADAGGGVQATFQNAARKAAPGSAGVKPEPVTHVLSARAHFDHASQLAVFYGTDATPARMWQDASEVQAATLTFDRAHRTFSARPQHAGELIHAIFVSNPRTPRPGSAARAARVIRVASEAMDYNDLQKEATFTGSVKIDGAMGEVSGQHAVVFLLANEIATAKPSGAVMQAQPSPLGGSIDRVVVDGSVELAQSGRHGGGEELLYNAVKGTYVLTGTPGNPPHITDTQEGNITGSTLVFSDAGSTIVVAGDQGARKHKSGRVRTETYVHSGKPERQ
ncbi:MAG: LPS export ABC transporter periplasmic protein LptC [Acidobacteriaceae bacterium]